MCGVCKPNFVKCFGPRLRLRTYALMFVPGPSFSKTYYNISRKDIRVAGNTGYPFDIIVHSM